VDIMVLVRNDNRPAGYMGRLLDWIVICCKNFLLYLSCEMRNTGVF